MEPALEVQLWTWLALNRERFGWQLEALEAAGVLGAQEGDEWRARAAAVDPPPAEARERAARLEPDRALARELYKADLIGAVQLRAAIEREAPLAEEWDLG